ncbi:MAG: tetratricopeptide repeat protein [Parvularculaceae bacterium]|nr:tetratricopeptide repeat protein [Parvularculaceae bacterium]
MAAHRSITQYAGASLCAILLAACASGGGAKGDIVGYGKNADYKDAVGVSTSPAADPSGMDPIAAAAFWGTAYDRTPTAETAVSYSAALRKIGSTKEAAAVMQKASTRFPDNVDVSLEYGKTLVEEGRAFEAVRHLEIAADKKKNDWRALSAYGVALDQIEEHKAARLKYDEALQLSPDNVTVLNNKGLSFALEGDLQSAIRTLRAATSNRKADARVRQNLALVLAINGDMREAERLARSDLPPQVADQNVAYFRQLMTQPAFWQDYAKGADTPDFSAPTSAPTPLAKPKSKKAAPTPLSEEPKQEETSPKKPVADGNKATSPTSASAIVTEPKKTATPTPAKPAVTPVTPASATSAKPASPVKPQSEKPAGVKTEAKPDTSKSDQSDDPAPNIKK